MRKELLRGPAFRGVELQHVHQEVLANRVGQLGHKLRQRHRRRVRDAVQRFEDRGVLNDARRGLPEGRTKHLDFLDRGLPREERLAPELNNILGWIEQLQAVDTEGVEPMAGGAPQGQPAMRMRPDEVTDGGIAEQVLANAPDRMGAYYGVPKVVE